jgi:holo-[acyl-carrier protein] synthase
MKASPYRVGIDIVDVRHIQDSIERFGERFLNRLFTRGEQAYCRSLLSNTAIVQSFAARFAAKEATLKVLRPETAVLDWQTIEIQRHEAGYCAIVLHADAADLAQRRGIITLSVSMSHEAEYATAVVVADFQ